MPLVRRPMTSVSWFVMVEESAIDSMPTLPRQPACLPHLASVQVLTFVSA